MSEVREGICVCGATFPIPIKRGRPPVRCPACREAYADGTLPDRLASLGVDRSVLHPRRIKSDPTSTPQGEINSPQLGHGTGNLGKNPEVERRIDELEMFLKSRNRHISQHRDK